MSDNSSIPGMNADIPANAVSIYGQESEALDDFPVLKAFQQYIDAEQAKARKRMLLMGIFFGALMFIVIAVFVALLMRTTYQNQMLNDRLLDFALRDRENRGSSAVVVQPPQDASGLMALNAKIDEMNKKLAESQVKAERAAAEAAAKAEQLALEATKPKTPSRDELEIERLKTLLAAEKEKLAAEKERKHQEEIENYRRKYYPELYERPRLKKRRIDLDIEDELDELSIDPDDEPKVPSSRKRRTPARKIRSLDDDEAIDYFSDSESRKNDDTESDADDESSESDEASDAEQPKAAAPENNNSTPRETKGSSSGWDIPLD